MAYLFKKVNYFMKYNFIPILISVLLGFTLISFSSSTLEIIITPRFNNKSILETDWYVTPTKDSIQFTKIKFYLTNFKLISNNGEIKVLENSSYLIDIFKPETLKFSLKLPHFNNNDKLYFELGVNNRMNTTGAHSGALDPSNGMYWSWQSGYINFKIEGVSPSCMTRKNKFQFHIGGYQNPHNTLRNFTINLNKQNMELNLNLEKFFEFTKLSNENQVLIPGSNADQLATVFYNAFSVF